MSLIVPSLSQSEGTDASLSQRQSQEGTDVSPSEEDTNKSDPDPTEKDLADDPCRTFSKEVVVVAKDTDLLVVVPNTVPLAMVVIIDCMKSCTKLSHWRDTVVTSNMNLKS